MTDTETFSSAAVAAPDLESGPTAAGDGQALANLRRAEAATRRGTRHAGRARLSRDPRAPRRPS